MKGGALIAVHSFLKYLEVLTNRMIRQSLSAASMLFKTIKNLTVDAIARWSGQGNKHSDGLQSVLNILVTSQEMGCQLVRDGQDLLRIYPDGRVERVEGLLEGLDLAQLEQQFPAQLAQLQAWIAGLREPENAFQLAQAEVNDPVNPPNTPSETPAPSADKLVARVAEISGSATVVRNGLVIQLNFGDPIYVGDIVSTADNAKLKLTLIDNSQPTPSASSALLGDQTRVLVSGQMVAVDSSKFFQVNLNVDAGNLAVDKSSNPQMQIQVFTPAGQLPVPVNGLNVQVQSQTGQTAVSTLLPPNASGANDVSTKLIAVDGNANNLQLSTTPTVLTPAVDPDVRLAQAATMATPSALVSAITGVSPYSPLTGNNLAAPLSASTEANPASALSAGLGPTNPAPLVTTVAPFVAPVAAAPKLANELAPPVIPKLKITASQEAVTEPDLSNASPPPQSTMTFEVKFSAATSLVVSFNLNITFSPLNNSTARDRFAADMPLVVNVGGTADNTYKIRYPSGNQDSFTLDKPIKVQPGETDITISVSFERDDVYQEDVTVTAELTDLQSGIKDGDGRAQLVLSDTFEPDEQFDGSTGDGSLLVTGESLDLRGVIPRVSNLDVLDLATDAGANEVILTQAFVEAMGGNQAVISIEGGAGDVLKLANAQENTSIWLRDPNSDQAGTPGYAAYKSGGTTVLVNRNIDVAGVSITSGAGTDTLLSGPGDDTITGSGADVLDLGHRPGPNGTTLEVTDAMVVTLPQGSTNGSAQAGDLLGTDTLVGIQNVSTGKGADSVVGNSGDNRIVTDLANDTVGSADTIDGGAGADTILAGAGADRVVFDAADSIDGGTGAETLLM